MSDTPTIVEKVATLKNAIRDLKQTLQDNNLINGNEQLSDYAVTVNIGLANEEIKDVILYTTADEPNIWRKSTNFNVVNGEIGNFIDKDNASKIIIPNEKNGNEVKSIKNGELSGLTELTYVSLPNTISALGLRIFQESQNLIEVDLPNNDSLSCIRVYSFINCENLEKIDIPNSIERIEQGAFQNCSNIKYLTFPDNLSFIGAYCFKDCSSLEYISVSPSSIETVETGAFLNCSQLSCIKIRTTPDTPPNDIEDVKNKLIDAGINQTIKWIY